MIGVLLCLKLEGLDLVKRLFSLSLLLLFLFFGGKMPKWGRIAMYGAAIAVATDYFIGPSLRKSFKL